MVFLAAVQKVVMLMGLAGWKENARGSKAKQAGEARQARQAGYDPALL